MVQHNTALVDELRTLSDDKIGVTHMVRVVEEDCMKKARLGETYCETKISILPGERVLELLERFKSALVRAGMGTHSVSWPETLGHPSTWHLTETSVTITVKFQW